MLSNDLLEKIFKIRGITKRELAEAVGIAPGHMSNIIAGRRNLTCDLYNKIMLFFHSKGIENIDFLTEEKIEDDIKLMDILEKEDITTSAQTELTRTDKNLYKKYTKQNHKGLYQLAITFIMNAWLDQSSNIELRKASMYVTWLAPEPKGGNKEWERKYDKILKEFIDDKNSHHKFKRLWTDELSTPLNVIEEALSNKTEGYFYSCIRDKRQGFFVIEGYGVLEYMPIDKDSFWVRISYEKDVFEAYTDQIKYFLRGHRCIVEVISAKYIDSYLLEAEKHFNKKYLIKNTFSSLFRGRVWLSLFQGEERTILEERLKNQVERNKNNVEECYIHSKHRIKEELSLVREKINSINPEEVIKTKAVRNQVLRVIELICKNSNSKFGFLDGKDINFHLLSTKNIVFMGKFPGIYSKKEPETYVSSDHIDVIHKVTNEVSTIWNKIPKKNRTDNSKGRQNILCFLIQETLLQITKMGDGITISEQIFFHFCEKLVLRLKQNKKDLEKLAESYISAKKVFIFSGSFPIFINFRPDIWSLDINANIFVSSSIERENFDECKIFVNSKNLEFTKKQEKIFDEKKFSNARYSNEENIEKKIYQENMQELNIQLDKKYLDESENYLNDMESKKRKINYRIIDCAQTTNIVIQIIDDRHVFLSSPYTIHCIIIDNRELAESITTYLTKCFTKFK